MLYGPHCVDPIFLESRNMCLLLFSIKTITSHYIWYHWNHFITLYLIPCKIGKIDVYINFCCPPYKGGRCIFPSCSGPSWQAPVAIILKTLPYCITDRIGIMSRGGYGLTKVNFVHIYPQILMLWSNIRLLIKNTI